MTERPRDRLHYLDALRGIAALAVVVYHYTLDVAADHVFGPAGTTFAQLAGDTLDLGKFGVVLFFLISGYIIPNSLAPGRDRIGRFGVSRFFRLYPLYWLAVAAGVFLPWPPLPGGAGFNGVTILANLTMAQGFLGQPDVVGTAWTLQIELVFYAACVLLAVTHRMASPRSCTLASAACLAVALAMAAVRFLLVKKLPVALPLALSLMFFGTVWRQATLGKLPEAKRLAAPLLGAIGVAVVPISLLAYSHDYGYHERWQPYVTCYLLAMAAFVACTTRVRVTWRPLVWLGEISYSLYLLHPLVAAALDRTGLTPATAPFPPSVFILLQTGLAVLAAWCTYRLVEQPCVRLGHALTRRSHG